MFFKANPDMMPLRYKTDKNLRPDKKYVSLEPLDMLSETQKLFYNSKDDKFSLLKQNLFQKTRYSSSAGGDRAYISRNILGNEN